SERGTPGPTSLLLFRVPHSPFRVIRVPGYPPLPPMLPHVAAPVRAAGTGPSARAFVERRRRRVDGAGALGHSPRHGVRGSGRPRSRGRGARSGGGFVAPARRAAVGRPRSRAGGGPRQSRSRGRGARAGAPRGRRT